MSGADDLPPTDPAAPASPEGAVGWIRRELSDDGGGHVLPTIGRGLGILRSFVLAVLVLGVVAAVMAVIAFRDDTTLLVVTLALCLPAVVAPLVAFRSLSRLREAVTHPQEVGRQLRDLLSDVTDSPELRALADRFRGRSGPAGPTVEGGRLRRALRTGKLLSAVVGSAAPDPDRHRLLVPFTPERTGRMFTAFTWSAWGILLALGAISMAFVGIVASAL